MEAGRSPLGPIWVPSKTVRVRARLDDPRAFDPAHDETQVTIQPGATSRVFLDLRPTLMLRTAPEPAEVFRIIEGRDSLVGETPIPLSPAFLEGRRFLLRAPDHADTTFTGESILALRQSDGRAVVSLRRTAETLPPAAPLIPIYRRRWLQWSFVGVGAVLTGASALLRREGDKWYDRYMESSDRRVLDTYFDRAVHYDHLSLAALGVGQLLFTGGVVLLVNGSDR